MRSRKIDIRQVLAAMLTLTMFAMLANMIKRDHFDFDYVEVKYPARSTIQYHTIKITEKTAVNNKQLPPSRVVDPMLWLESKKQVLKPCWNISSPLITMEKRQKTEGYITFSLTKGPEFHISEVANAVVVAKYLGAKLLLPDIEESKLEATRNFSEIYDDRKFFESLKGVIKVVPNQHDKMSSIESPVVQVPNMVSEAYIEAHIKPLFEQTGSLRLSTYFPSRKSDEASKYLDPVTCLAMFGTLQLQPGVREVFDDIVRSLGIFRQGSKGRFVAVDLRDKILHGKSCSQVGAVGDGKIDLCSAAEIGEFLRKIGFGSETAIYVTQSRWHENLDPLRKFFPRTYTKELLMESDKKLNMFLDKGNGSELERVLDFYMCCESDVYVPTIPDLFSKNVVGERIASGRGWVLVPDKTHSPSTSASNYISPYISKKTHLAYSCFCEEGIALPN